MGPIGLAEAITILAMIAIASLVVVWPAARICRRVGLSPWLGILAVVPIANVVLLWFVAFSPWPGLPLSHRGA